MKRIIFMLPVLFSAACYTGCNSHKKENEIKTKLSATSALVADTSIIKEYVCQIHSVSHIELRAQERGYLEDIYVDEGQKVKKGQLLFRIMPKLYQAELQKAQAEVRIAEIEYQNTKTLTDRNVVAPAELAMAKAKYDKTKAELALAQVHLGFTEIRAPFDGIIGRFHVRPGSLLEEGDLLTTLSDNRKMWVYFNVPEAEYLNYRSGAKTDSLMQVDLLMANQQQFPFSGIVETIEADFNNETGNIAFRATFPNSDMLLRHNETGNILMKVPFRNALIIPQKATFEILDKKYVYVIDKDDRVQSREITIAAEMPDLYIVKDGLKANEKILLEGLRKVREKDKVTYEYHQPEDVISHLKIYVE